MHPTMRVGACSLSPVPGDIEENLKFIKKWTIKGADEEVDLLLFPELSLSGYWLNHELYDKAQPRDGPAITNLVEFLANKQLDVAISVGLAEKHGGTIYNTQILLDKDGERYFYRKTHWPPEEYSYWGMGNKYPIHRFKDFTIATTICYDNNFPEIHRIYGLQGSDLVLAPYFYGKQFSPDDMDSITDSIFDWKNREKMYLRASAAANYHWIVACVGAGPVSDKYVQNGNEGETYYVPGVILFVDPEGNVVKESSDEEVVVQLLWYDIDLAENMRVRKSGHNYFKNRRPDTYGKLVE